MGRQMVFPIADSIDYSTETIVGNAGLGLFVNVNGERFINESLDRFALSAAVMKQPEEKLFIISDALNSGLVNGYNEQGYSRTSSSRRASSSGRTALRSWPR